MSHSDGALSSPTAEMPEGAVFAVTLVSGEEFLTKAKPRVRSQGELAVGMGEHQILVIAPGQWKAWLCNSPSASEREDMLSLLREEAERNIEEARGRFSDGLIEEATA